MHSKAFSSVEIKDADKGYVEAVFSTFNVIDHDGDVTDPGAFEHGAKVAISAFNHQSWGGALPVGKGRIEVGPRGAVLKGEFFMDTQHGRDTFATVKALASEGMGDWSYGFDVEESAPGEHEGKSVRVLKKLKVYEVSPVLRGAGVGTRTLAMKMESTDLDDLAEWVKAGKPKPKPRDEDDPEEAEESEDEDSDDEERDGRRKPKPKPKPKSPKGAYPKSSSLREEIDYAVDAVKSAIESAERVGALRAEAEKQLSNVNRESLDGLRSELKKLDALLDAEVQTKDVDKEFLRYVAFNIGDTNV